MKIRKQLEINMENIKPCNARDFYETIYSTKKPAGHPWVAGTASPELINLVWEGVISPGMKVLEAGCGIGTESVFLAVRGMDVTSIDLSESAISLSKQLAKFYGVEINFQQGDATNPDFPDESFDVICEQGVFHHLTDEEREPYAKTITRLLRPNGLFVLRSYSDKIPGGPQPRRIKSDELIDIFHPYLKLEELRRVLSFSSEKQHRPLGWYTLWEKR